MEPEPASLFFDKEDFPYELGSGGRVYGLRLVGDTLERAGELSPERVDKFWRYMPDQISREKAIELLRILKRSKFADNQPPTASSPAPPPLSPVEIEAKQRREEFFRRLKDMPASDLDEVIRMFNDKPENPQQP